MADARVTMDGNLTRNPELKFNSGGKAVANLGIAVEHRSQAEKKPVSFFNIVAWGELGEHVAASLTKGQHVVVTGQLRQRSYESNGEKKSVVEIWADEVSPSLRFDDVTIGESKTRTQSKPSSSSPDYGGGYEEPF